MITTIVDITSFAFLGILFARRLTDKSYARNRQQLVCCASLLIILAFEVANFYMKGPAYPLAFRKILFYITNTLGIGVINLVYLYYVEFLISEKATINPWVFRILKIVEMGWVVFSIPIFFLNCNISYQNEAEIISYSYPHIFDTVEFVILLSVPLVSIFLYKRIGVEMTVLNCLFGIIPLASLLLYYYTGMDIIYASCSITFLLIDEFIQRRYLQELLQNNLANHRVLLDYFVEQYWAAYFVDLEKETFEVLHADSANLGAQNLGVCREDIDNFIETHFNPEDIDILKKITNIEYVCRELQDNSSISYTVREIINDEERPMRFQVIRCADEKHVLVGIMDISSELEEERNLLKDTKTKLVHEKLRSELLNFMVNNEDDPIELLKNFAERVRVLINCDQVIYRDLEETRVMVNSPAIEESWSVPIEYCKQCQHFDAHHPMYEGGYTEMEDCKEGWQGIPVYDKCPIKSSLTRITYCDGEVAGYLAIHYIQEKHKFTDMERETIETFARILSISLSRFKAKKENKELKLISEMKKEAEESQKLIESIAANYNVAYSVNLNTDEFRLLRMDDTIIGSEEIFDNFTQAKNFFIGILPESDQTRMQHELDYNVIREKLKDTRSYFAEYRVKINNSMMWHVMNITAIDDDYVAIGFAMQDAEITQKHLEDKRYSEFFGIFEVDLDSGMMKVVKDSPYFSLGNIGIAMPYREVMLKFASMLDGEAKEFFERFSDIDTVKSDFLKEDKLTFTYQSSLIGNGSWVDCISYITMRHDDGTPAVVTIGFSKVDSLGVYRLELQSKYKEALDIVSEEKQRNDLLHEIIHSGKWSFAVSADDEITDSYYSEEVLRIINNDFSSGYTDWVELLHPDDAEAALTAFNATIRDHTCLTPYDVVYRMLDRNGEYHWFRSAGRIVRHEDGTGEFFGIHIDISGQRTEQLKQQKLLEDAREAADSANRAKSNFLFNMSHDIRTPMNAIRGFTTMAKKHADNKDKVMEYLDKIDISGEQLLKLINQVLEMARIESGKITFEDKPIDVEKEFNSMVTVLAEQANENGLHFKYELGNVEHKYLLADEARMGSITLNIVGNAMKYTPVGGTIEFGLRETESRKPGYATFVFTVADTGIGMSEEYLKELYEPFSREKNSTVSRIQGTGLGLSIVKSLLDLLGGEINVESELGKGTRFEITVDFKIDDENHSLTDASEKIDVEIFRGRRVLLVEDNEMNREIARDILEEHGLLVEDAQDGDIAVEMVKKAFDRKDYSYYDFVLMDVQMPRMNGYEATKAIRAIPGSEVVHIPIIAMTANAFDEDRQNALAAGMDEHLAKPLDITLMFNTLAKFLH